MRKFLGFLALAGFLSRFILFDQRAIPRLQTGADLNQHIAHPRQDGGVKRLIALPRADRVRLLVPCDFAPDGFPVRLLFLVTVDQFKHLVHTLS